MKTIKLFFLSSLMLGFTACSNDDDGDVVAEACTEVEFFADADNDGLGDANTIVMACEAPDGFVANADDNDDTQPIADLVVGLVADLHAPQTGGGGTPPGGPFTKFDLDTMTQTDSETDWDIALRGTTILVNGGVSQGTADEPDRTGNAAAYIATGTMDSVVDIDTAAFVQDAADILAIPTGSDNGWYNYNPATFTITPLAGKILVFRTTEGQYAKIEILSYYEGAPANPDPMTDASRYYTFNLVYQPNNGIDNF